MKDEQQIPFKERLNQSVNVLFAICHALALPSVVFLHRDIGSRYVGPRLLLTIVVMGLAPGWWPRGEPALMLVLLALFLVQIARCNFAAMRRRAKGETVHRYSDGTPRLLGVLGGFKEPTVRKLEPVLVFVVGVACLPVSEAMGAFLVLSAIGWAVTNAMMESACEERIAALRDQQIEQRNFIEMFRERYGK